MPRGIPLVGQRRKPAGSWTCPDCSQTLKVRGGHSLACGVDLKERFWSKVHKGERCWIWTGAKHFRGYGACAKKYGDTRAHRVSWLFTNGPIPKGLGVLHKCDTPLCVNPSHLYLGDQKQNNADTIARGRRGHKWMPVDQLRHPHLSKRIGAGR